MPRMSRTIVGLAVAATAVFGPAASAGPLPGAGAQSLRVLFVLPGTGESNAAGDTIRGGCWLFAYEQAVLTNGQYIGVVGDVSATTERSGLPVGATVTCFVRVNGVVAPGTTFSYTGVGAQVGVDQVAFSASDSDEVSECEDVVFNEGNTTAENCVTATEVVLPPDLTVGAPILDATLCPQLRSLGPSGIPGVIAIYADGDVYVANPLGTGGLDPVYDCPPYDD